MTILAKIKSSSAVRLYAWLSGTTEVELSLQQAAECAGIHSRTSLTRARKELEELGVIHLERRDQKWFASLAAAVPEAPAEVVQLFTPRELTLAERADIIDQMPDDGGRKKGSNHLRKEEAQYTFLREVYQKKFPDAEKKLAVSNPSIRKWLTAEPRCYYILEAMEDVELAMSTKDVPSPAAYITWQAGDNRKKREKSGAPPRPVKAPSLQAIPQARREPTPAEREQIEAENYRKSMEEYERLKASLKDIKVPLGRPDLLRLGAQA